jgi:hypothetical protein
MQVSRDNISGFLLGISVGAAIGLILKASDKIRQEEPDAEFLRWSSPAQDAVSKFAATRLEVDAALR